jgi:predicted metalloprotease with PDZ domain
MQVKIDLPPGPPERDIQLPVWNAVYQVRDFARNVNWVRTKNESGQSLPLHKVDKSRWHVSNAGNGVHVEYEIFANETGPYGAELNSHHAFFNPAEILMYAVDARSTPLQVRFTDMPRDWKVATALEAASGGEFLATDYDQLVDSPIEISNFKESDFDEGGARYRVVIDSESADRDMEKVVSIVRRAVKSETQWMNDRPFQTFLFLYHFPNNPGGGMEHSYSTAIEVSSQLLAEDPVALPSVTAHEFFHLWNVKRIRPQSITPYDYTKENYTTALWFSEGVTNTVGDYTLLYAGFLDEQGYLARLVAKIAEYELRPARLTQSAEESSLDAWLEKYDDYRLPQRSISYYNKGELLGVLLDLNILEASQGTASLRDVFHWMNTNYAQKGRPFADSDGVREAVEAVSHADFKTFFQKYVAGTEEIPWDDFFRTVGLHLERRTVAVADTGFWAVRNFDRPPNVVSVVRGSEAEKAGLAAGDSIIEINGHPAGRDFDDRVAKLHPGDTLRLQVHNASGKRDLEWKVGRRDELHFELKDVDNMTLQQKTRRVLWLKGDASEEVRP